MNLLSAILCLCFLACLPVRGAIWYVDSDVSTNGNGTSWATAWRQLGDIVWASINVTNDTIYVSGVTNTPYTNSLSIGKSGTIVGSTTNYVRVYAAPSTETGHFETPVLITGGTDARIRLNGNSNIRLRGWITDPSTTITNADLTTNLHGYINWRVNQTNANTSGILATGSSAVSNIWIEGFIVDSIVNTNSFYTNSMGEVVFSPNDVSSNSGIGSNAPENTGWWIRYNIVRNMGQDAMGLEARVPNTPDDIDIAFNYIHDMGDDGIELTGGATIRHNFIARTAGLNGHPDSLVVVGDGNAYVYGNKVYGYNTYFGAFFGAKFQTFTNVWIANNVFQYAFTNAGDNALGITVDQTLAGDYATNLPSAGTNDMVWRDIHIINNTIVGSTPGASFVNRYRPNNTSNTNYNFNVIIDGTVEIRNNIFLDATGGSTVLGLSLKGYTNSNPSLGYGIVYSPDVPSVVTMSHNILGSTNANGLQVLLGTNSAYHATILAADSTFGLGPDYTNRPSFNDLGSFTQLGDYRVPYTDTAANAMGSNLTAYAHQSLTRDYLGRIRPASGNWTIGAFEAESSPETNLLVFLTFDDDFTTTNRITDFSGNNLHAYQWGFSTNPIANWPWRTNDAKVSNYAGAFKPDYNVRPYVDTNFWTGRYAGITSNNNASAYKRLTNMAKATVMTWAKFNSLTNGQNSTSDHNGTMADGGYGARGAWHFGRYNSTSIGNPRLLINTNAGSVAAAPQLVWTNGTYTNDVWNHYAFTADCTDTNLIVVKLYFNGSLLTTTNIALQAANAINGLVLTDAPGSTNHAWLCIGAWQHNGTPTLDDAADGLPNNGFMNGQLDNMRIYDRTLSDSEVSAIYAAEAGTTATGGRVRKTTQLIGRRR